jgi:galactokinase
MTGKELLEQIKTDKAAEIFQKLYGPEGLEEARRRYAGLIEGLIGIGDAPKGFPAGDFPETAGDLRVFSAPGRTELGGNHTDHNQGKVLAASIQLDSAAIVAPRRDKRVLFRSTGYPDVAVDLSDLAPRQSERGTTESLVRGIAAELSGRGVSVGGFTANAASTVLSGSGLSSSAAVEVLFGRIFDSLYGGGKRSALEIAQIGQIAENDYFGKPSGLMDQAACASGGAVAIDFGDIEYPLVTQIDFDLSAAGYALCVVDTHGSHADLTPDYAAVPEEMRKVARLFGKTVLRELSAEEVLGRAAEVRKDVGDRALLRALHFFRENERVDAMLAALEKVNAGKGKEVNLWAFFNYLDQVNQSGDSSWELLQNIYSPKNPAEQSIALALAVTREFFDTAVTGIYGTPGEGIMGACRVHGGGFAGTIQAYIPLDCVDPYRVKMEALFGAGAVRVLRIRPVGAVELKF